MDVVAPSSLSWPSPGRDVVRVLDFDRDLLAAVPAADAERARAIALARAIPVERGAWRPPELPEDPRYVGLLVLKGLLARDVSLGSAGCTELLGPGDVLRPGEQHSVQSSLPFDVRFQAEQHGRVAVLDGRFIAAVARWPGLTSELAARTVRRSHALAMQLAITFVTGTDVRLHALFWHLADRWGRVERDGVVVSLPFSHERLARLVRGRRPAISHGLKRLAERDLVIRRPDGAWLLRGGPPDQRSLLAGVADPHGRPPLDER